MPQRLRRSWVVPQWRMPLRAQAVHACPVPPRPAPPAPPRRARPAPAPPRPPAPRALRVCSCRSHDPRPAACTAGTATTRPASLPERVLGHGRCASDGTCGYHAGWMRFDCSERRCPSDCSGGYTPLAGGPTNRSALGARGLCVDGSCVCLQGWTGADCSKPTCPAHEGSLCGGHGVCDVVRGSVPLREGWAGPDCAQWRARPAVP